MVDALPRNQGNGHEPMGRGVDLARGIGDKDRAFQDTEDAQFYPSLSKCLPIAANPSLCVLTGQPQELVGTRNW